MRTLKFADWAVVKGLPRNDIRRRRFTYLDMSNARHPTNIVTYNAQFRSHAAAATLSLCGCNGTINRKSKHSHNKDNQENLQVGR
jgi:hypothetical protein